MLAPLALSPSFGFGDRLGLATPGHIASVKGTKFAPIFAQQSVRENARTGRTPQQVMDDAKRAVEAAKWDGPWGADADHLKTVEDIQTSCVGISVEIGCEGAGTGAPRLLTAP